MSLTPATENSSPRRRFVPSLSLANFGTGMLDVIASLFLVEIALTFFGSDSNSAVGAASSIAAFSSAAAVIFGVLNGFLSVRFRHKSLLLFGALCIIIGAVGCYLAPSFLFLQIFYPFDGVGTIIVGSMAMTLIGENVSLDKRAKAISWVVTGAILSSAIGFPLAGFIEGTAGWRSVILWYILPISIVALVLAFFSIPNTPRKLEQTITKNDFLNGFKQVLFNKSAVACLVGNTLITAAGVWSFFAAAFWIKQFHVTVQLVSIITFGVVMAYALGSIVGGRFINLVGRKRLVVITWMLRGLLILLIVFMPTFWTALVMSFLATFVGGFAVTSGPSLSLEQAPKYRGTMMSIGAVFAAFGSTLGVSVGGIALGQFGFQILGIAFGIFGFSSALVIFLFAKDPCKS